MTLQNGLSDGHWKQALKSSFSVALGVITAELAAGDLSNLSTASIKHTLTIIIVTVITAEARYWQKKLEQQDNENP